MVNRIWPILLLLSGLCIQRAYAQLRGQARVDSLLKELVSGPYRNKEDTNKAILFKNLSLEYSAIQPDEGVRYGNAAIALSEKLNWKRGVAMGHVNLSSNFMAMGDYNQALAHYRLAIPMYEQVGEQLGVAKCNGNIGLAYLYLGDYSKSMEYNMKALHGYEELDNTAGVSRSLINVGSIYWQQSNYPKAQESFLKALKINEAIGDLNQLALLCNNIGALYRDKGDYPMALEYQFKSLKYNEQLQDNKGVAGNYTNIGNVYLDQNDYAKSLKYYFKALDKSRQVRDKIGEATVVGNIGLIYQLQQVYEKALKFDVEALQICEELGDQNGIARNEGNIGSVYLALNDFRKGLDYTLKSIAHFKELGNRTGVGAGYMTLGSIYLKLADDANAGQLSTMFAGNSGAALRQSKIYADSAVAIAMETGDLNNLVKSHETLSEVMQRTGDYKGSLESYRLFKQFNDSVFNLQKNKKLTQISMQYEFDKKESEAKAEQDKRNAVANKEIQRQKLVRNGFIGGFALMMLFAGIFFRQRNHIKEGKERSDELLLNILPAEVAEELKASGSAETKYIEQVTVLFTDFKGFTQLSELLSPRELVAQINECFSAFDHIMQRHGVEKIKTIGDAYMAAGGLPTPNKTHAVDVVTAALEIQRFMEDHKVKRKAAGEPCFEIRIGVHTGPVVAGIVGVKKFAYDIWGDTVNTASRMESSGATGMVNISEATYEIVKEKYNCTYRGEIEAKGKGAMKMYFVGAAIA
jgi:adenylate cyclase